MKRFEKNDISLSLFELSGQISLHSLIILQEEMANSKVVELQKWNEIKII